MNKYYLIKNYNKDTLCLDICNYTGTPLSYVYEKPFIGYLNSYLLGKWKTVEPTKENHLFCGISLLIENEYVDYSFIDDYSNFYSKSYADYKKKCMRIHFFNTSAENLEKIYDFNESTGDGLKKTYLGFIVIRPIPEYYIARACLKKWHDNDEEHLYLTRKVTASILGIDFEIDSIPFMEQDHETSVCATSALWTFFLASNFHKNSFGISPTSITHLATIQDSASNDNGLVPGFTVEMIRSCIKDKGLLPISLDLEAPENKDKDVVDLIHTFLKSDYPIILGLQVYSNELDISDIDKSLGAHAVTVVGDKLKESKVYVHDDRIGFFARLKKEDKYWRLVYSDSASKVKNRPEDEFYVVTDLVTGIYPKIRLPISAIQTFSENLKDDLVKYVGKKNEKLSTSVERLEFEFFVVDSNKLKKEVRQNYKDYINEDIENFLYMPLPKYCWISTFSYQHRECMSFVFDATDMIHGNCLLYILFRSNTYLLAMKMLYEAYQKELVKGVSLSDIFESHLAPLFQYYNLKEKKQINIYEKLDELFGIAKSPTYVKDDEYIADEIKNQKPVCITCLSDVKDFIFSEKVPYYLWIIDEEGYLYIGQENFDDKDSLCKGHPTLINGRKGRIGGEIWCEIEADRISWYFNYQSGRYSWIDTKEEELTKYMENVFNERINIYFPENKFSYKEKRPRK